jgi:tetratricopeptide (TPR) repeat protein
MAIHRKLDAPGSPSIALSLISLSTFLSIWLVYAVPCAFGQDSRASELGKIEHLFREERWSEVVKLAPHASPSADLSYYQGTALARLERWDEARTTFESGVHRYPRDPRFPIELAGVAFKQNDYAEAQSWLNRGLHLAPNDEYANSFLATTFFLRGNLEAALKYWNRAGKPKIEQVSSEPAPRVKPVLLDRAFAFSASSILLSRDLQTSQALVDQLGIFRTSSFELQAREGGNFDLTFHHIERNGCAGKWGCLFTAFGSTPAQTLRFNYFNLGREAINFRSAYRWDAQKRRILAELDSPLAGTPRWHLKLGTDLRNENWGIRDSSSGSEPVIAALNLKKEAARVEFTDVVSGKWHWAATTEFSHRTYNNVLAENVLTPQLLTNGNQLKQAMCFGVSLLRVPERRFTIDSETTAEVAKLWSAGGRNFARFSGDVRLHWFPQPTGDKYELEHTVHLGTMVGDSPFDELYTLGVLGDSTLLMRAHVSTEEGKKGRAPMGRSYFLSNWDATRNITPRTFLKVKVGPFVDTGKITDSNPAFGSHEWLWDIGIEAKVQVFGFGLALSYGRDLRSGRNASIARSP